MTRGVEHGDLEAYSFLYVRADMQFINTNLRNSIQVKDFDFYIKALTRVRRDDNIMFCYFDDGCNQNLMGIIRRFFSHRGGDRSGMPGRQKRQRDQLFDEERKKGMERGIRDSKAYSKESDSAEDHADMAGGIVKDVGLFHEDDFFVRLVSLLRS